MWRVLTPGPREHLADRQKHPRAPVDAPHPYRPQPDHPLTTSIQVFGAASGADHTILVCALLLESMTITDKNTVFICRSLSF